MNDLYVVSVACICWWLWFGGSD